MMSSDWRGIFSSSRFKGRWHNGTSLTTGLLDDAPPEIELSDYRRLPGSGSESPSGLLNGEGLKAEPISDLDIFFERLYNYYCENGLWCIIIKWVVELLSLGFAICFSAFFLLIVNWHGLRNAKCGMDAVESGTKPCDLAKEALHRHPLVPFTFWKGIIVVYLGILTIYWLICFLRFFLQLKDILEVRKFYYNSLNVTDREVQTTPWPEILEKVVQSQRLQKLCVVKDLSAHDIIMRIMRKENYLIGMINKCVLAFQIPWWVPGVGPTVNLGENGRKNHLTLTKTLEWALNWCILQTMFDRNFCIRRDFISNPSSLRKWLMIVGIGMLLISPVLVIFMLVYLFLRHAEQFYNHPSTASSRRWSNLSKWIFREFNEVDHLFKHRINSSVVHASDYLKQFPSPIISLVAKFISFVCGGFAAILIIIAFLEESLLEGHILGRNLLWYAAVFGTVIAISRAAVSDELQVLDPEGAMSLVVQHTHYMPKRWRGKENTDAVRMEFETMFQYTGMMLLEEMASIFLTPYLLIFVVPKCAKEILQFISEFTVDVEGVGHVCSLSVFDFKSHGNSKYGSPYNSPCDRRSSQGKMEKSFLSFQNAYPTWEPNAEGQQFLANLCNFREQQRYKETQGYPSRDVPHYIRCVPPSGYNPSSPWLINSEQRTPPYLLDWYYLSQPLDAAGNPKCSAAVPKLVYESRGGLWPLKETVTEVEENYNFQPSNRQQSHFEASSSSSPYVQDSILHHRDWEHSEDPTESQIWARPFLQQSGLQTSFLEPPSSCGHPNYGRHNTDVLDRSLERLEEGHVSIYSRKSHSLSRTTYLDDSENDELNLPFLDICSAPPLDSVKSGSPRCNFSGT